MAEDVFDVLGYLDPKALSRLGKVEIVARMVVEGFLAGLHRSPYKGFAVEFAEHRQYVPGDEIRHIDWKVYAKSDRYYVKLYEEATNLRAYILLDASGSMGYGSTRVTKFRYGRLLAAALSYLMLRQTDSVGLVTFDTRLKKYIPPRSVPTHLRRILDELASISPAGATGIADVLHDLAERFKRRGLIVLISDLFDDPKKILSGLAHFCHKKHEVVVFQVLDRAETDFSFDGYVKFRSLESDRREVLVEPRRLRRAYLERFEAHASELARGCRDHGIDFVRMLTDVPHEKAIAAYLSRRALRQ